MAIQTNFPAVKPALLLDFANTKRLDTRITFTRTTTATYYDGVTTAKAEENLLLYSQDFDNITGWSPIRGSISANTTTAPDGTSTADSLIEDSTASNNHYVQPNTVAAGNYNGVVVNGSIYSFSVFAKANTRSQVCLGFWDGSTVHTAFFDLSGGTVLSSSGVTASIVNAGNGWYRCVGVRTNTNTTMALSIQLSVSGSTTYTGDGTSGIYIWGAQLEQRSSVTAYTATTTQPITNYIPVLLTAASGVARLDHNPTTDEPPELLIEEARTNLLTYSADFSNAAWSKTRSSITSDTIVAPDGTLTGDKLVEDTTASNTHNTASGNISFTSGTSYSFSVYAKAGERTVFRSQLPTAVFGAYVAYNFDLSAGTVTLVTAGTGNSASITSVGNGWYRCTTVAQATATASGSVVIFLMSGATITYTGNGYSGIYIWGAQLEAGAFPTSYIATTSATVTRNADAASMTGSNFTSWFNPAEGTVYFESQSAQGANAYPYSLFGSSTSNRIFSNYNTSNRITSGVRINGTFEAAVTTNNDTAFINTFGKGALAYKVNDFGFSWNGAAALTDTSTTLPIIQELDIGNNGGLATNWLNGRIRKIAYYPIRLTNAQLQALTS